VLSLLCPLHSLYHFKYHSSWPYLCLEDLSCLVEHCTDDVVLLFPVPCCNNMFQVKGDKCPQLGRDEGWFAWKKIFFKFYDTNFKSTVIFDNILQYCYNLPFAINLVGLVMFSVVSNSLRVAFLLASNVIPSSRSSWLSMEAEII